jgi:hypothetical protein
VVRENQSRRDLVKVAQYEVLGLAFLKTYPSRRDDRPIRRSLSGLRDQKPSVSIVPPGRTCLFAPFPSTSYWAFTKSLRDKSSAYNPKFLKLTLMVSRLGRRFRQGCFSGLYRPPLNGIDHRGNPAISPLPAQQIHYRVDQTVNVVTGGFDIHFQAGLSHRFGCDRSDASRSQISWPRKFKRQEIGDR